MFRIVVPIIIICFLIEVGMKYNLPADLLCLGVAIMSWIAGRASTYGKRIPI